MDRGPIERCRTEIAAIEAEILAGNPDLPGLCLALSDWHAEWRIRNRLERLEDELLPPPAEPAKYMRIRFVDSRRGDCYGFDPENGDPNFKEPEPLIFQIDPHREPGWHMGRRYPRTRGHW
jgi:hypothetical protein